MAGFGFKVSAGTNQAGGRSMLKALVFYAAIAAVLFVALIASRRSEPQLVKHRSVFQQRLMTDDTE